MAYIKGQFDVTQYVDTNGDPAATYIMKFFIWDTSTPTAVYSDSAGTSLGTSVTLNSLGQPQTVGGTAADIFFDTAVVYKAQLYLSDGTTTVGPEIGPFYPLGDGVKAEYGSFAEAYAGANTGINIIITKSFYGGWAATIAGPKGGATYHRDGTTGTASTAYSDNSGFYDANGDGFRLPAIADINVLQFGAKGDGSTDDTTAIVNANAFGEAIGHCKLTFPYTGSAYIVTSGSLIIATDFTDWIGDGGLVEIKCTSATGDVLKIEGNDVNVYRLYINGDTGTRVTSGRGVYMDNGESFTQHRVNLIDCQILNQPGHGIEGIKQENARHENLWIQSCGGKAYYFHDNGGTRGINCTFINCRAYACGSSGDYQWHIYNQTAFTFENCQSLEGTHTYEVFIQAGNLHELNGFDMERATSSGSGILISGSNHKILNPLVRNFVTVGIDVNSGTSVDIENPRIISNTATPVGIGIRYTSSSGRVRYNDDSFSNVTTNYSESGTNNVQKLTRNVSTGVDNRGLREIISAAATMTPDAESGGVKQMTLDQNLLINAPTNPSIDAKLRFNLIQGGVGGYTTTWDSIFKFHTAWSDAGNTTGTESTIEFVYTGSKWMQTQTQTGWTS